MMISSSKKSFNQLINKRCLLPVIFALVLAAALFTGIKAASKINKYRFVFQYPLVGKDRMVREVRFVPKDSEREKIVSYVEELIDGSFAQRTRPLFSLGTVIEFCFLRNDELYVGLSKEALYSSSDTVSISEGIKYLEKNIRKNFHNVKKISVFIDGNYIEKKAD